MRSNEQVYDQRSAAYPQNRSIFVSLEVSRSSWLELAAKGKPKGVVVTAIVREIAAFLWAIGQRVAPTTGV